MEEGAGRGTEVEGVERSSDRDNVSEGPEEGVVALLWLLADPGVSDVDELLTVRNNGGSDTDRSACSPPLLEGNAGVDGAVVTAGDVS